MNLVDSHQASRCGSSQDSQLRVPARATCGCWRAAHVRAWCRTKKRAPERCMHVRAWCARVLGGKRASVCARVGASSQQQQRASGQPATATKRRARRGPARAASTHSEQRTAGAHSEQRRAASEASEQRAASNERAHSKRRTAKEQRAASELPAAASGVEW